MQCPQIDSLYSWLLINLFALCRERRKWLTASFAKEERRNFKKQLRKRLNRGRCYSPSFKPPPIFFQFPPFQQKPTHGHWLEGGGGGENSRSSGRKEIGKRRCFLLLLLFFPTQKPRLQSVWACVRSTWYGIGPFSKGLAQKRIKVHIYVGEFGVLLEGSAATDGRQR